MGCYIIRYKELIVFGILLVLLYLLLFKRDNLYESYTYNINFPCDMYGEFRDDCYDEERVKAMERKQQIVDYSVLACIMLSLLMLYIGYRRKPDDHWAKKIVTEMMKEERGR